MNKVKTVSLTKVEYVIKYFHDSLKRWIVISNYDIKDGIDPTLVDYKKHNNPLLSYCLFKRTTTIKDELIK